jgi:hypothetical protein
MLEVREEVMLQESKAQCDLLLDIFGNVRFAA